MANCQTCLTALITSDSPIEEDGKRFDTTECRYIYRQRFENKIKYGNEGGGPNCQVCSQATSSKDSPIHTPDNKRVCSVECRRIYVHRNIHVISYHNGG